MKYAESKTAQRRVNGDNLLHLKDIADERISIIGYEQRQSQYHEGTYLILTVALPEPEQHTVKVATSAAIVMERVVAFFAEHPTDTLEAVITKRTGRQGREYWTLLDPDEYERQSAQSRTVRYPKRGECLVRAMDVTEEDAIPF